MRRLLLISSAAVLAFAQTPIRHGDVVVTADYQQVEESVRHLSGHVVVETDSIKLQAEKLDFNENTQEIQSHGDTRIQLK
jgi:lipopolysaccharide export system protein LptA